VNIEIVGKLIVVAVIFGFVLSVVLICCEIRNRIRLVRLKKEEECISRRLADLEKQLEFNLNKRGVFSGLKKSLMKLKIEHASVYRMIYSCQSVCVFQADYLEVQKKLSSLRKECEYLTSEVHRKVLLVEEALYGGPVLLNEIRVLLNNMGNKHTKPASYTEIKEEYFRLLKIVQELRKSGDFVDWIHLHPILKDVHNRCTNWCE